VSIGERIIPTERSDLPRTGHDRPQRDVSTGNESAGSAARRRVLAVARDAMVIIGRSPTAVGHLLVPGKIGHVAPSMVGQ
jgi:hypothetical protein